MIISEGMLALAAALAAIAFRRRKRILAPPGFIMLALGFALDVAAPHHAGAPPWSPYIRAAAIALIWCGVIRLAVESIEGWIRRTRMHLSTITTEFAVTILYAIVFLIVSWRILGFDARQLFALPVAFTLISGWLQHRDLFAGFLIQSQKPFRPGDWVRVGDQVGQVHETGWRATRIRTRAHENLTVPSDLMAKEIITNYSAYARVADEVTIALGYEQSPGVIEEAILEMLSDIPELLKEPAPEIAPSEFGDWSITYRIRYWLRDYAAQEAVQARVNRSLWYVMQRHALGMPAPATLMGEHQNGRVALNGHGNQLVHELRRVDLFGELSDEELHLIAPSTKTTEFGRGERLIRQGEAGDCFFILRRGEVEIIREAENGRAALVVGAIQSSSARNFFGEIALLKGEPRNTTVRAKTDVEVLRVDRAGFTRLFRACPWIANEIAKIAAIREQATLAQTAEESVSLVQIIAEQQGRLLQTMRRIFDF